MRLDPIVVALINVRRAQGLTQKALADRAGIHPSNISAWEQGTVEPRPDSIRRWAAGLGIDLRDDAAEVEL